MEAAVGPPSAVQKTRFTLEAKHGYDVLRSGNLPDSRFYKNCPFTMYRVVPDATQDLQTTVNAAVVYLRYAHQNVSRPGCWA